MTYTLHPGDARVCPPGDIHSPKRNDSTKLIRMEGLNMDSAARDAFEAVE